MMPCLPTLRLPNNEHQGLINYIIGTLCLRKGPTLGSPLARILSFPLESLFQKKLQIFLKAPPFSPEEKFLH